MTTESENKQLTSGISGVPPVNIFSPFVKAAAASSPAVADGITGSEQPDDIGIASTKSAPVSPGAAPKLPPATDWKAARFKEHQHAELLRLKAGQEGCGCSDCQKFYQTLDLSQFGDRVKHYGNTVMVLAGTTGAGKQRNEISEGWHLTEKYGDVFVSPSGKVWSVKQIGDKLENVIVEISAEDLIQKPSAERMKHAAAEKRRYNLAKLSRKQPLQPLHKVSTSTDGVTDALTPLALEKPEKDTLVNPSFVVSKVDDKNQTLGENLPQVNKSNPKPTLAQGL